MRDCALILQFRRTLIHRTRDRSALVRAERLIVIENITLRDDTP